MHLIIKKNRTLIGAIIIKARLFAVLSTHIGGFANCSFNDFFFPVDEIPSIIKSNPKSMTKVKTGYTLLIAMNE